MQYLLYNISSMTNFKFMAVQLIVGECLHLFDADDVKSWA